MKKLILILLLFLPSFSFAGGQAYEWGDEPDNHAAAMAALTNIIEISGNSGWALAIKSDGTLYAWGTDSGSRVSAIPSGTFTHAAAGWYHGIGVRTGGTVVEWGTPFMTYTIGVEPWITPTITTAEKVCAGDSHSAALLSNGTVRSWSFHPGKEIFNNMDGDITDAVDIACGWYYVLVARSNGTVVVYGQGGIGEQTFDPDGGGLDCYESQAYCGLTNVAKVRAGLYQAYAIKNDGTLSIWGFPTTAYPTGYPELIPPEGATNVFDVAGGGKPRDYADGFWTIVLKNDGTTLAWGNTTGCAYCTDITSTSLPGVTFSKLGQNPMYFAQGIGGTPSAASPATVTGVTITGGSMR